MRSREKLILLIIIVIAGGVLARAAWVSHELRGDREVIQWLRAQAIPLATVEPAADLSDLKPLGSAIGDARIVGVGEATHGTREHFLFKHRLLRYLVTEKGFGAMAFESPWPTGLGLNDYVLGGEGDPKRLLGQAVFGVWHTEEVLAMIEWMRAYNATVSWDRRVEFVGIDMQLTRTATRWLAEYLQRLDADFRETHATTFELLSSKEMETIYLDFSGGLGRQPVVRSTSETREVSAFARELPARLDSHRARYIAASSAAEFDIARQHANILSQQAQVLTDWSESHRDRFMADNLDWYMARRPGIKTMIWAHNDHVALERPPAAPPLGGHLKERHGSAYVSAGFVLGSGAYWALDARPGRPGKPRSDAFRFSAPPRRTFNGMMAAAGPDLFAVDLRTARGATARMLGREVRLREGYGIVTSDDPDPLATLKRSMPATHDIVIFIEPTTPARPLRPSKP